MRIDPPALSPPQLFWMVGTLLGLLLMGAVAAPGWLLWRDMADDLARVETRLAAQADLVQRTERLRGEAVSLQPWTGRGPNPLPGKNAAEAREAMAAQILRLAADAGLPPPGLTVPEDTGGSRVVAMRVLLQAGPRPLRDFLAALETERPMLSVQELHLRPDTQDGGRLNVELAVAGIMVEVAP